MFGSSLPLVVCMRARECLIYIISVCLCIVMSTTYCVVLLFLLVCCFFFFFFLSCVPFFASFSGLFILDFPSVFSNVYCNSHTDHTTTYLSFTICQWLYLRYALVEVPRDQHHRAAQRVPTL